MNEQINQKKDSIFYDHYMASKVSLLCNNILDQKKCNGKAPRVGSEMWTAQMMHTLSTFTRMIYSGFEIYWES